MVGVEIRGLWDISCGCDCAHVCVIIMVDFEMALLYTLQFVIGYLRVFFAAVDCSVKTW